MRYLLLLVLTILMIKCKQAEKIGCSSLKYLNKKTILNGNLFTGECNSFFPNGKKRSIQRYTSGLDDGNWIFYFENGKIQTIGKFNNGKRIGEWKYYYKNGNIKQESFYDSLGRKVGSWKLYDPDGKLDWVTKY